MYAPSPQRGNTKFLNEGFGLNLEMAEANFKDNMVHLCAGTPNCPFCGWLEKLNMLCPEYNLMCVAPHCFEQFQVLSNMSLSQKLLNCMARH